MLIRFDDSGPLHRQLYSRLREEILSGRLAAGARLPATRALATDAGVSRNTVLLAYEQLLGEGYAVGRAGSGTYVPEALPGARAIDPRADSRGRPAAGQPAPRLSHYGHTIADWEPSWVAPGARLACDFRYGRPALADFPHEVWRRLIARRLRKAAVRDLDYGPPAGALPLREAVAEYLRRSRGVACTPEQIIIVHGSQQALDLTARVLLDPGDQVLLEEPHYPGAWGVFLAARARIVTAPVDGEGMDVAALPASGRHVRLAYVTPSHQYPTGAIMSVSRRLALLAWAARADAYVLEDDYDSEYRYAGRPIAALQGLDRTGRVIYAGTFSKVLSPGMRLGYVVAPEPLRRPFLAAKALADTGCSVLLQLALADFIREGHFGRHVRRTRARNAARRAVLLEAIQTHLGDAVAVEGANAGLHVLLWLRRVRANTLDTYIARAAAAGVGVYSAASCYVNPPPRAMLLLGYNALTEREIETGIRRLAEVLKAPAKRAGG